MKLRLWALAAFLGSVLAVAGWVVYIAMIGLERADQLSSVVGAILAAVFGVAGLVVGVRGWRRDPGGDTAPAAPLQINQASGGATVYAVQGGNLTVQDPRRADER